MASPVGPVTPVTANIRLVEMPYAPPAEMHGGPVQEFHSSPGEQTQPYPWEEWAGPHGPYGPAEDALLSDLPESRTFIAGTLNQDPNSDQTPYRTHAGPTISGMETSPDPDANARVLMKSYMAHSVNTGAARPARASSNPLEDQWVGFQNIVPGENILPHVPGQVSAQANGFGANDYVNNAYHKQNEFGLDSSHRHRRFATGPVPGNYMWLTAAGRPLHKTLAGPSRPPVGEGPFSGQDPTESYGIEGAILLRPASEYAAPPGVMVSPPSVQDENVPAIPLW